MSGRQATIEETILKEVRNLEKIAHTILGKLNEVGTLESTELNYDPLEAENESEIDPHPVLTKLREWEGLHEQRDKEVLMGYFEEAGFSFDPVLLPWCGAGLRAALVHAGYEDPGEQAYKASNYQFYGDPVETVADAKAGDIWISNTHVAVIVEVRDDGVFMIIGCNQNDGVCVHPTQNRDGKKNYGDMIAIRRPPVPNQTV